MSGTLYRLLYCSRNKIVTNTVFGQSVDMEQELRTILAVARRRNKADNVTGALLFTVSGFAQVLEGYREVVERTFERIGSDPRHADVTVLAFTPTERRSFPDWSMGFSGQIKHGVADPLAHLLSDATFSGERATTGGDLLRMLEKVVQREDEWIVA
jgi:blue light- and temperature-responsive anti-repressor